MFRQLHRKENAVFSVLYRAAAAVEGENTLHQGQAQAGAAALAKAYDFSGGQIENIARKHTVDSILFGYATADLERIKGYCDEELIVNEKAKRKIGF